MKKAIGIVLEGIVIWLILMGGLLAVCVMAYLDGALGLELLYGSPEYVSECILGLLTVLWYTSGPAVFIATGVRIAYLFFKD